MEYGSINSDLVREWIARETDRLRQHVAECKRGANDSSIHWAITDSGKISGGVDALLSAIETDDCKMASDLRALRHDCGTARIEMRNCLS